jgi:hypothetical protein
MSAVACVFDPSPKRAAAVHGSDMYLFVRVHNLGRTEYPWWYWVERMAIEHGCAHVLMAQQFLDRADFLDAFQEMRGKGIAKGVAAGRFGCAGLGTLHGLLHHTRTEIMAALRGRFPVNPSFLLGSPRASTAAFSAMAARSSTWWRPISGDAPGERGRAHTLWPRMAYRLFRREGWTENNKRVQRLCREEGLQRPTPRKRKRARPADGSVRRHRAEHPHQVLAIDFQFDASAFD